MRKLTELDFDNTYARLPGAFYGKLAPTPLSDPYLVSFNEAAAGLIDLDPSEAGKREFVEYFSGNRLLPGSEPLAMIYAGHQFGQYVQQLGDGRAILLGEVRNSQGEKWDLQLKGSGQTPYSRGFDGRAVLRSSIREYLCSEATHGLGIPTTRALCIVGSDAPVYRETTETAAVLLRMAPSHVRFGSFEVFYYRSQFAQLKQLADYVIAQYFPELADLSAAAGKYHRFLTEVVKRTARLIAEWQAVGFAHGVMNTDNMSILGITIDYGPYGFLDEYNVGYICNHSDHGGRYAFGYQPSIGLWNLDKLAQSLLPLISEEEARASLDSYEGEFNTYYGELMRAKLGLQTAFEADWSLLSDLLRALHANQVDYTTFFRRLGSFESSETAANAPLRDLFVDPAIFDQWAMKYRARLVAENSDDAARKEQMNRVNPKYILRNYLAQNAITKATEQRDYSEIDRLLVLLHSPFAEQPEMEEYAGLPPNWSKEIVVSCSS